MRLFHYALIPVLDNKHLVAEWRECIAIKRQWEKGTLKHRLVSYVKDYPKYYFAGYVLRVVEELQRRRIKYKKELLEEIIKFAEEESFAIKTYPEHNDRYLKQCYFNLQEKFDRKIITEEEWKPIDKFWQHVIASENDE